MEWTVIKFKNLEEAETVYGKDSLVGISKIDQIIFDLYNLTDEEKAAIGYIEIQ